MGAGADHEPRQQARARYYERPAAEAAGARPGTLNLVNYFLLKSFFVSPNDFLAYAAAIINSAT